MSADEIARLLVDKPVEPKGILSRLEQHVTQLRDHLHRNDAYHALIREMRSIADHDAHIMAARHEFTRDFLTTMQSAISTVKATLQVILEAQHIYNTQLGQIASYMYGQEARDRAMTRLVEMERRLKRLETMHERSDDQAGGAERGADVEQGDGQAGPGPETAGR